MITTRTVVVFLMLMVVSSTAFGQDAINSEGDTLIGDDTSERITNEEEETQGDVNDSECDGSDTPCIEPGSEAEALPRPGSLPLSELNENVEEGEEQFGGCRTTPNGAFPLSTALLLVLLGVSALRQTSRTNGRRK